MQRSAPICAFVLMPLMLQIVTYGAQSRVPDIQGFWTNGTATPLERPADFAATAFFTPAEAAEFERTALERVVKTLPPEDQIGADLTDVYYDHFTVVPDRRTSLIPFTATNEPVLEYACHEGNYSMVNTLRGASAREKQRE
jgi:hypothetical protein